MTSTVHSSARDLYGSLSPESVSLVWTDPPFGTGEVQTGRVAAYADGPAKEALGLVSELAQEAMRFLVPGGVMCVLLDYRIVHHAHVALESAGLTPKGEVIWEFGLGRPATKWWANKHNTILLFAKPGAEAAFDYEAVPVVPRLAPKAGYPSTKKVASVWRHTMNNTDPERVGYPNQKPLALIEPFIRAHTKPGDLVIDPFMGSGSTAIAAIRTGRRFSGSDISEAARRIANARIERAA